MTDVLTTEELRALRLPIIAAMANTVASYSAHDVSAFRVDPASIQLLFDEIAYLNRLVDDLDANLSRVQARSTEQTNEARGFRYFGHDAHNRGLAGIIGAAYAAVCKHGDFLPRLQHIEDGTGGADAVAFRAIAQAECAAAERGEKPLTWRKLVEEEVSEIFAETDPAKLKAEIAQTSAALAAWSLAIDARGAGK